MKILNVISPRVHTHPREVVKEISAHDLEGIRIVFINMPLRESAQPNTTPEGPLLLATNLRENYGVETTVVDLNAYRIQDKQAEERKLPHGRHLTLEETRRLIRRHFEVYGEPDIVALSGIITTLRWQEIMAKLVKDIVPDTFLVSGNGLATELRDGLFNYIPELDAVSHSEGDDIILKICLDAKNIKRMGLESARLAGKLKPYYLEEMPGKFLYAGDRPLNLDILPFADLDLLKGDVLGNPLLEWYLKTPVWGVAANNSSAAPFTMGMSTTSVSSRGCPFACKYCFRGQQGERNWGVRSEEHIHREMVTHAERYGIDFKGFPDDNFAVDIGRIEKMVPLLGPLQIQWGTHTRMDEGADIRRIKPMADAGCVYIGFGPESANAKTLEAIGKGGHTLSMGSEKVRVDGEIYSFPLSMTTATRNCVKYGIHANCTWIMGSPTETLKQLKDSVAFIRWQELLYDSHDIPVEAVNKRMFTMTWYPGTELITYQKVRDELTRVFGISFRKSGKADCPYEPVCDEKFYKYLLELDDATKVLEGPSNEPLNFSDMQNDVFLQVREHIDSDQIFRILEM